MTRDTDPAAQTTVSLYADDTLSVTASETWEDVEREMRKVTTNLETYSSLNGLCLSTGKNQTLKLGVAKETTTLTILGVEVDKKFLFSPATTRQCL